jgi:cation diffusion facilitator CzcD-associated flavoprotein CzcO
MQCDTEPYIYIPLLEELGYWPSEKYGHGPEILKHIEMTVQKWDLGPKTLVQMQVTTMDWDEENSLKCTDSVWR